MKIKTRPPVHTWLRINKSAWFRPIWFIYALLWYGRNMIAFVYIYIYTNDIISVKLLAHRHRFSIMYNHLIWVTFTFNSKDFLFKIFDLHTHIHIPLAYIQYLVSAALPCRHNWSAQGWGQNAPTVVLNMFVNVNNVVLPIDSTATYYFFLMGLNWLDISIEPLRSRAFGFFF